MAVETSLVDGAVAISIAEPGGPLESLGYSENGVEITEQIFTGDVHGDQNGGDQGPPIEVQYFGEVHTIRLTLTSWDEAVLNKIRKLTAAATIGVNLTPGTLLLETHSFRLLLNSTNRPRNYLRVLFREAREINKGTKHSKAVLVGTAYKNASGVLYNTTTT